MTALVWTIACTGQEAHLIEVQCRLSFGLPAFHLTGLPEQAAADTCRRVRVALASAGLALPAKRIKVHLPPEGLVKEGSHYDLPVALALLSAMRAGDLARLSGCVALGELDLNGRLLPADCITSAANIALEAKASLICPASQAQEAYAIIGEGLVPAPDLLSVIKHLNGRQQLSLASLREPAITPAAQSADADAGHHLAVPPNADQPVSGVAEPFSDLQLNDRPDLGRRALLQAGAQHGDGRQEHAARGVNRAAHAHSGAQMDEDPDAWRSRMPANVPGDHAAPGKRPAADHPGIGHRARLRKRLIEGDIDALADYEVIEFLLFAAFRRRDTKPLAKTLIKRFGSLAGVLNADAKALVLVPGVGDMTIGALKIARVAARQLARSQVVNKPVLKSWPALIDYLQLDMGHLTRERVRVLYLTTGLELVKDELISEGSIAEAQIHPREVMHRAFDLGAAALILVHNHPSGSLEPSKADITITNRIAEAGRLVNITVVDHIIISSQGHVSLKQMGLI
ncbi:DNA repair protein RadC [Croceicoccus sp. F390]|uniref:DNA repair protein RadC n=1 Tax=Croceicoccus esteveae TaxID=3075597 RepID=A0ABU2ZKL6_9SPHN|nr:DNA repair protein RadC [Croceicoccus sp. F390]MDT0575957.1 DNA repair protein RadC [Croceicoccus sp. F390]